jgi:hypothetical protein
LNLLRQTWIAVKKQTDTKDPLSGKLRISKDVIASEFGGGVSIMNLETNAQFRLEGVAWFVWRELAADTVFEDLCISVQDMYRVSRDVSERDLQQLLSDLLHNGLIVATE